GPSGENYSNIQFWEIQEEYLRANFSASYLYRRSNLVIYEVVITPAKSLGLVSIKIEQLKGLSTMNVTMPPGIIYVHSNIWVFAREVQKPGIIKSAIVKFRIDNKWLADNSLYNSKIKLLRWNEDKWVSLPTELKGRDENFTYYESITDGFEHFAVSIDPVYKAVPIYPINVFPAKPTATPQVNATQVQRIDEARFPQWGYVPFVLILVGILLYRMLSIKRKK
ncbi:MAG: PGF-pre-PGF domain-containing protein, partial [Candidatus Methanoperedens sp.]|nr:PGF-pre-PGF domain-containing protein [Candidatus Methanoperedens sp.]